MLLVGLPPVVVFGAAARALGLQPRHRRSERRDPLLVLAVDDLRQRTAKRESAERLQPRVHRVGEVFVDLRDQRHVAWRERVGDVVDEIVVHARVREIGRGAEDEAGDRTGCEAGGAGEHADHAADGRRAHRAFGPRAVRADRGDRIACVAADDGVGVDPDDAFLLETVKDV